MLDPKEHQHCLQYPLYCVDVSFINEYKQLELYEPNSHEFYSNRSTVSLLKPGT